MFPLQRKIFPATAPDLREVLEQSLRRLVRPAAEMVTVVDRQYPRLTSIQVSLDGANVNEPLPQRPVPPVGNVEPGLEVENFAIIGRPIVLQGAKVEFACTARELRIGQGHDAEGNLLLLLQDAAEGGVEVALALPDLEALALAGAKAAAARQGVTVERVQIDLQGRGERALDVVVQVEAKKLFLSAGVRIGGSITIDEQLVARLSGWECTGEGTLGSLACGFIIPHLAQLNGREFSLMALPLGEVKLRDVRVTAGRELRMTAQFGHAA